MKNLFKCKVMQELFVMLMISVAGLANAATLIVNNGFESGNLNGFTCSGNCPGVNSTSKMTGNYGGDFDLTRNMTTSYRTEVEMGSTGQFNFNQEYWIGFNYRHEDWAKDTSPEIAPIQIHNRPSSWLTECTFGSASYNPFNMVVQNDVARIEAYRNNVFWSAPIQKNQWLSIVFHFKISTGNDGYIEAWKDGVKLGRVDGLNQPLKDNCNQPMRTPYFKMGTYKWEWRSKTTQSTRRRLFIDNLKIASGSDGYSLVSSASAPADTTKPIISSIVATPTANSATITWTTDEPADSLIEYGLTTSYGSTSSNSSFVTSHSRTITGLQSSKLYHYRVKSKDQSNNLQTSADKTFTTGASDTTPPVLSNIQCTPTATSATCTWTTNEAANSEVRYGLTSAYGLISSSPTMATSHSRTLTGLQPETTYHYQIRSTDAGSNTQSSADFTFTTSAASTSDTTPPVISNLVCTPTENSANCTWTTNEASSTKLNYGLTGSYGTVYNNANLVTSHSASLSGLSPETTYHFQAQSTDASNNTGSSSPDMTFTTLAHVETTPTVHQPVIRKNPCD